MLSVLPSLEKLNISCSKSITPQILIEIAKQTNLKVFKNKWHSNSIYHGPKSMTIQLPGKIDEWSNAYSQVFLSIFNSCFTKYDVKSSYSLLVSFQLFHNAGKNLTTLEFYAAGISNASLLVGLSQITRVLIYPIKL